MIVTTLLHGACLVAAATLLVAVWRPIAAAPVPGSANVQPRPVAVAIPVGLARRPDTPRRPGQGIFVPAHVAATDAAGVLQTAIQVSESGPNNHLTPGLRDASLWRIAPTHIANSGVETPPTKESL